MVGQENMISNCRFVAICSHVIGVSFSLCRNHCNPSSLLSCNIQNVKFIKDVQFKQMLVTTVCVLFILSDLRRILSPPVGLPNVRARVRAMRARMQRRLNFQALLNQCCSTFSVNGYNNGIKQSFNCKLLWHSHQKIISGDCSFLFDSSCLISRHCVTLSENLSNGKGVGLDYHFKHVTGTMILLVYVGTIVI